MALPQLVYYLVWCDPPPMPEWQEPTKEEFEHYKTNIGFYEPSKMIKSFQVYYERRLKKYQDERDLALSDGYYQTHKAPVMYKEDLKAIESSPDFSRWHTDVDSLDLPDVP